MTHFDLISFSGARARARAVAIGLAALCAAASPAHAANQALLIGNSDYEAKCEEDIPTVPADVGSMAAAVSNAGYAAVAVADRIGIEMTTDAESNVPPPGDEYVIYYVGHGEAAVDGSPLGVDCTRMTPTDLIGALGDAADGTLLILDSCASGDYADAVNALDDRICTITSTTGSDCRPTGVFTPCFVAGLNGAADADHDGLVTVEEAAVYAIANCGDAGTLPTWDGGCPSVPIGVGPVAVDSKSWGEVKARYR